MKNSTFSVLFILTLCFSSYAQAICPITTLKTNNVRGKVLWNDKTAAPITKTKVDVKRLEEEESLVTSTLTDETGFFEIHNLKKGLYGLDVWLYVMRNHIFPIALD